MRFVRHLAGFHTRLPRVMCVCKPSNCLLFAATVAYFRLFFTPQQDDGGEWLLRKEKSGSDTYARIAAQNPGS